MLRKALVLAAALGLTLAGTAHAATTAEEPKKDVHWSFERPFGTFDTEQLQRGYKVYHDVCSACHGMDLMHYYSLGQPGGPFFETKYPKPNDNPRIKAIAADFKVPDIDSDTFTSAARAFTRGLSIGLGYLSS